MQQQCLYSLCLQFDAEYWYKCTFPQPGKHQVVEGASKAPAAPLLCSSHTLAPLYPSIYLSKAVHSIPASERKALVNARDDLPLHPSLSFKPAPTCPKLYTAPPLVRARLWQAPEAHLQHKHGQAKVRSNCFAITAELLCSCRAA